MGAHHRCEIGDVQLPTVGERGYLLAQPFRLVKRIGVNHRGVDWSLPHTCGQDLQNASDRFGLDWPPPWPLPEPRSLQP
jgi:hypothetical protein